MDTHKLIVEFVLALDFFLLSHFYVMKIMGCCMFANLHVFLLCCKVFFKTFASFIQFNLKKYVCMYG